MILNGFSGYMFVGKDVVDGVSVLIGFMFVRRKIVADGMSVLNMEKQTKLLSKRMKKGGKMIENDKNP